jgi:spore coat protein U-like protein
MTPARAWAAMLAIGLFAAVPAGAVSCSMGIVNVVFGTYNTLSASSLDGAGSVSVTCTVSSSFQVALSKGHGSFAARQLQSGANVLYYNLYTDALRSLIWGDGTVGTTLVSGSGTAATYTVYGRIPGGQNLPAGSYGDSITVTLDF